MSKAGFVGAAVLALLLVGAAMMVARGAPPTEGTVDEMVDRWLAAMAEPSGDRGWSLLSADTQRSAYADDPRRYWRDLEAVDWSRVVWAPATGYVDDGVVYLGSAALRSHPSTLPHFLLERRVAGPYCIDELPYGIHVVMPVGWSTAPRISAGAGPTGSADRCAAAFDQDPGARHEPFDLVGGAWGSPSPNQRVGVIDRSAIVTAVGPGRENPPVVGPITVAAFERRMLALAWEGSSCDSNTTLIVGGSAPHLEIVIDRGVEEGCVGIDVTYEVILDLDVDVAVDGVDADLAAERGLSGQRECQ